MSIWLGEYTVIQIARINGTVAIDVNNFAYDILEEDIEKQLGTKGPFNALILLDAGPTSNGLVSFQREAQIRDLLINEILIGEIVEVEVIAVTPQLLHVKCGQNRGSIRDFKAYPLSNNPPDQWMGRKFMVEKIGPRVGLSHHFSAKRVNFENMFREIKVGDNYTAVITNLVEFGAFLLLSKFGCDTLLHKTNMNLIENHLNVLSVGDEITVSVQSIDQDRMRINVSLVGL